MDFKEFLINALLLQSWFPDLKSYWGFNPVSWSISCEMFFYVFFVFLLWVGTRNLIALTLILLLAVVVLQVELYGDVSYWIFYISPVSRLLEFLFGMLVFRAYLLVKDGGGVSYLVASWMEIASITIVALAMGNAIFTDVGKNFRFSLYYLFPMTFIVFAFSFDRGVLSRLLANRVLVYLGESSYCLYMIHLMFLGYVIPRLFIDIDKNSIVSVLVVLALMAVCIVPLSCLLHSAVEKPLNKYLKSIFIRGSRTVQTTASAG